MAASVVEAAAEDDAGTFAASLGDVSEAFAAGRTTLSPKEAAEAAAAAAGLAGNASSDLTLRRGKCLPVIAAHQHSRAPPAGRRLPAAAGLGCCAAVGTSGRVPEPDGTTKPRPPPEKRKYCGMQHQGCTLRSTPDPLDNMRWPEPSWVVGGPPGPNDTRRNLINFGASLSRNSATFVSVISKEPTPMAHTLTLETVKAGLTKCYGSLWGAFAALDFFRDGKLSSLEWQDGVYNTLHKLKGEEGMAFRALCYPRDQYNKRMTQIFRSMDVDNDGVICFEELAREVPVVVEKPRDFTMRLNKESLQQTLGVLTPESSPRALEIESDTSPLASASVTTARPDETRKATKASEAARAFMTLLLEKYSGVEEAFKAIDVNGNGELSMAEFTEGCKMRVRFNGDAKAVFKEIDIDGSGAIVMGELKRLRGVQQVDASTAAKARVITKRDLANSRKRTDVADPPPHSRGLALDDLRVLPLGARVSTMAGFYSFSRSSTGRLDNRYHPEEVPGFDPDNFTSDRGPGYCSRGPENFHLGCHAHPVKGNSFKSGATINRVERFGPIIPSSQARQDRDLSAAGFASYKGQSPADTWSMSGTGAVMNCGTRMGRPAHVDSIGVGMPIRAVDRIGFSATLPLHMRSAPSLLCRKPC